MQNNGLRGCTDIVRRWLLKHLVFLYGMKCLDQMLTSNAYTLFARTTLTVWTSEMCEDFWMIRLVRVGPAVQLCLRAEVGPVMHILSMILVLVTEKGSRVRHSPVAALDTVTLLCSAVQLCPWAKSVRATAAWISLQPWSSRLCCPLSFCWSLRM